MTIAIDFDVSAGNNHDMVARHRLVDARIAIRARSRRARHASAWIAIFIAWGSNGSVWAQSDAASCATRARDGDFVVCERAVAAQPNDPALRRHLAFAYLAINDKENCLRVHRETVALAPDDAAAWLDYAVAAATFWDYRAAVTPIREALRLAPDDREAHRVAALVFNAVGDMAAAVAVMRRGAELGDPLQMFALALALQSGRGVVRDTDAARAWLVRAGEAGHVGAMDQLGESDPTWAERARRARDH